MKESSRILAALLLGIGVALAGFYVGEGFFKGRSSERFVTVKGVSERNVMSDVAFWPIRFVATDDDLGKAQAKINDSAAKVLAFLQKHGIQSDSVEMDRLEVNDLLANPYRTGPIQTRYIITQALMVRCNDPKLVQSASQDIGELVEAGVVLSATGGPATGPTYLFTGLSDLKPEMIAEATANARRAAEQFATDSGSSIGAIRRANQGVFVILPRDRVPGVSQEGQMEKTVRVVTTIEYYLGDQKLR
jgi:hypothetical protein